MTLYAKDEAGGYRPARKREILAAASKALLGNLRRGQSLTEPADAKVFLQASLSDLEHEVFAVIFLDNRHCLIDYQEMFRGTINGTAVYPREVAKEALKLNAAAVILAHNHPSGIAEPSRADELLTTRLKETLGNLDIRVLDHIVVAKGEFVSFTERGLL